MCLASRLTSCLPPPRIAVKQAALICARLAFMQAVIFATSGMNSEQSRMASGVQACWTSALTSALARSSPESDKPANNASKQIKRTIGMGIPPVFESPVSENRNCGRRSGGANRR
jgi:hypothetical protein